MYQIHKWEEKANQLFKNLSSPCYDLSYLSSCLLSPCKDTWRGKKWPLLIPIPHFPLVQHAECGFDSSWRTCPGSSRCTSSGDGTLCCVRPLSGAGRVSATGEHPEVVWNIFMLVHSLDLFQKASILLGDRSSCFQSKAPSAVNSNRPDFQCSNLKQVPQLLTQVIFS